MLSAVSVSSGGEDDSFDSGESLESESVFSGLRIDPPLPFFR